MPLARARDLTPESPVLRRHEECGLCGHVMSAVSRAALEAAWDDHVRSDAHQRRQAEWDRIKTQRVKEASSL